VLKHKYKKNGMELELFLIIWIVLRVKNRSLAKIAQNYNKL